MKEPHSDYEKLGLAKPRKARIEIHYFGKDNNPRHLKSKIKEVISTDKKEQYIVLENNVRIRTDRIIAIENRVGPAYDDFVTYSLISINSGGLE